MNSNASYAKTPIVAAWPMADDNSCPSNGGGAHDWIPWSGKQRCRLCGHTKSGQ